MKNNEAQQVPTETETKKARKMAIVEITSKLSHIMALAAAGEPVYDDMAARIEARAQEAADSLIREALEEN